MIWNNPSAFLLFLLIGVVLLYLLWISRKKQKAFQWSSIAIFQQLTPTSRVFLKWIPFFLQWLSLLLMVIALARPQVADVRQKKSLDGIDIIMVLDISFSMMAEDMDPGTRLSAAKKVIQQFVSDLSSDRVGLILFSGESYTKIPLTLDYLLFQNEVQKIETLSDIQQGTAIGVAITNAIARLRHSQSKSRVMILLTDGENNAGKISPETAIAIAKQHQIKIYPIGIGSNRRARIPIKQKDLLGLERTTYAVIDSKVNQKLLTQIAKTTGGKFYMAKNLKNLQSIFDEIGSLEKTPITISKWVRNEEKFQDFLKPALIFYAISVLLSITVFGKAI